jgi:hypothetical protein
LAGLLVIAVATLVPNPGQVAAVRATPVWCLVCGNHGGADVLNNLLLFVPFAAGLRLIGFGARTVVGLGAVVALVIESLQFSVIPGRDASLSDLLTNTLGSWIGTALVARRDRLLKPGREQGIRLAGFGVLVWLLQQAGTSVLLQPWAPSGQLRGAWARTIPGRNPFDGRVTSAFLSGFAVPHGSVLQDSALGNNIRQGRIHLELGLISGGDTASWSPVFELLDGRGSVLAVEVVGRDLVFQAPARSSVLRLRRPALRLGEAIPLHPGVPVQVATGERNDTLWGQWELGGAKYSSAQVLSPSFGWSLVTPIRYAYGRGVRLITALWIAAWLLPIGYWSAHGRLGRYTTWWLLSLVLLVGLGLVPRVLGYPAVHWSEWLAAVAGLGIGWAGPRSAAYLGARCEPPSTSGSY